MRSLGAVAAIAAVLLGGGLADAQPYQPPPPQWQQQPPPPPAQPMMQPQQQPVPPPAACFPECRPGYLCNQGQCVSACNPPCDAGMLCTPSGQCVSACNPPCDAGLVCAPSGQCVSACNPACAPGQVCQNGQCLATQTGAGLQLQQPTLGASMMMAGPADAGWANGAGIFGIVSMVAVATGVIAIIAIDDKDAGLPIGIVTTLYTAAAVPIIAAGAGSARNAPGVIGSPGLRTGGWIAFGLTILDAMILIGIAASDGDVEPPLTASVGALGEVAILFFTLDAFASASQAEAAGVALPVATEPTLSPFAGLAPTPEGKGLSPVLGVRGTL